MRPVGEWSAPGAGMVSGYVVSTSPEDSAYPDEKNVAAYRGHLVAESIAPEMRQPIAALPDLIKALEMVRDADEDCKKDGLPRWCTDIARATIDAALAKAGIE